MKLITLRDALIILAILVPAMIFLMIKSSDKGDFAEISYNGKVIETVSLSEDSEFEINGVLIKINDNSVSVVSSPCNDRICVKTGEIKNNGETIICLPQKISVRIISSDKKETADIIVG